MKKKYLWLLWIFLPIIGCEDLEDTYSDYAGDGEIRYLGKCSNVSVSPGWERLIVRWTNNVDPAIEQIKVTWALDDLERDSLLPKEATECSIPNLSDGNYEVNVYSVDKDGNTSLSISLFARPYTAVHETIRSFTRLFSRHYFVKDRLVLFFLDWDNKVESAHLSYVSGGVPKELVLDSAFVTDNKYFLLPDKIDEGSDVVLTRTGRVEGCDDLIVFEPEYLNKEKVYSADFKLLAESKYGQEDITDSWVDTLSVLEYDYSVSSFEDILKLPNLEKLVLGKNRYLRQDVEDETAYAQLTDMEVSRFALDVAHEVCGLEVERYGKHYFSEENKPDYVTDVAAFPEMPELDYLDATDWVATCSWEDTEPYDSHLEYLFDGNSTTNWMPELISAYARTYEVEVNMQEMTTVRGVCVSQPSFVESDNQSRSLMPTVIQVEVSKDLLSWENATYSEENTLGVSNGEKTIIYFKEPIEARYLRFTLYDQLYGSNYSVTLAGIDVF